MKILFYLCGLLVAGSVFAAEVEIEFRFQPDTSGENTYNQYVRAEEREGVITAEISDFEQARERSISLPEFDQLVLMVRESMARFEFDSGDDIDPPYIEILLSFEGEDREIEIKEIYAEGDTPFAYVQMQQRYFQRILQ